MTRWRARISAGGLVLAGLSVASCRGCLETDVDYADGTGGAPGATGTTAGPLASTGSTSDASSSGQPADTSSAAESTSTGVGPSGSSSSGSAGGGDGCVSRDDFRVEQGLSECWTQLNEDVDLVVPPSIDDTGRLVARPVPNTGWWGTATTDTQGWFMYQLARVDFVVSVDVEVTADPKDQLQMAGLLIRDPRSDGGVEGDEEWIKWELGYRDGGYASLSGANRISAVPVQIDGGTPDITGEAMGRLGICKLGTMVHLAFRPVDGDFDVVETVEVGMGSYPPLDYAPGNPDQEHIQVGLIANAFDDAASLVALFDNFRFDGADQLPGTSCIEKLDEQLLP